MQKANYVLQLKKWLFNFEGANFSKQIQRSNYAIFPRILFRFKFNATTKTFKEEGKKEKRNLGFITLLFLQKKPKVLKSNKQAK